MRVEFVQLMQDVIGDLAGAPEPVELKLFSRDQAAAERAAQAVAAAIEPTPGLVDLFDGVQGPNPELRVELDPARVARLGLTAGRGRGPGAGGPLRRRRRHGARAGPAGADPRAAARQRARPRATPIARVPIVGPGGWLPLAQLGEVRDTGGASELLRENLRPYVAVTGRTSGRSLGGVMGDVRRRAGRVALPAGVTLRDRRAVRQPAGRVPRAARRARPSRSARCCCCWWRSSSSFRGPLAIVLAVPLGVTGALMMLGATGVPFNVSSFMGLILLVGLIVKNGILLLDAARHASDAGRRRRPRWRTPGGSGCGRS